MAPNPATFGRNRCKGLMPDRSKTEVKNTSLTKAHTRHERSQYLDMDAHAVLTTRRSYWLD
jgi:hypothetical protein